MATTSLDIPASDDTSTLPVARPGLRCQFGDTRPESGAGCVVWKSILMVRIHRAPPRILRDLEIHTDDSNPSNRRTSPHSSNLGSRSRCCLRARRWFASLTISAASISNLGFGGGERRTATSPQFRDQLA
jgi:hypothetical protein